MGIIRRLVLLVLLSFLISLVMALEPTSVSVMDRRQWCTIQISSCQNICIDKNSSSRSNDCNYENLQYNCVCNNNFTPDTKTYTQTIPYFICQYEEQLCEKGCASGSDSSCVVNCRTKFNCVATDPPRSNKTTSSIPNSGANPNGPNDNVPNNRLAKSNAPIHTGSVYPSVSAIALVGLAFTLLA
ncbi:MAG: hypothetical protein DHS80DRAFT_24906 [Piptocephalis tieghemiana]|nr:MAG: hypothetical protein DHS80DRAFT_24906 [Piptocephalis tieghemiana]